MLLSALSVEADTENPVESAASYDQAQMICGEIGDKFGNRRYYWEVFDPHEVSEPVAGDLGDDFADIYQDVKDGLVAFNAVSANEGLWHWQYSFRTHWGNHLVNSLRAIHHFIFGQMSGEVYLDTSHV